MVDEKMILHLAKLARLTVTKEEIQNYIPQIQKVLNHFSELNSLETEKVEPLYTPVEIKNIYRTDLVKKEISTEVLIELAPEKSGHLYKVPPVIG